MEPGRTGICYSWNSSRTVHTRTCLHIYTDPPLRVFRMSGLPDVEFVDFSKAGAVLRKSNPSLYRHRTFSVSIPELVYGQKMQLKGAWNRRCCKEERKEGVLVTIGWRRLSQATLDIVLESPKRCMTYGTSRYSTYRYSTRCYELL